MHEVNILPPLSNLARFFLTQQLIFYKSKTEKHNFSLDIFVSNTNVARNLHLLELEKKYFSYVRTHTLFGSDSGICFVQNQRTFEDQGLS